MDHSVHLCKQLIATIAPSSTLLFLFCSLSAYETTSEQLVVYVDDVVMCTRAELFVQVIGPQKHRDGTELLFDFLQQPKLNKQVMISHTTARECLKSKLFPEPRSHMEL